VGVEIPRTIAYSPAGLRVKSFPVWIPIRPSADPLSASPRRAVRSVLKPVLVVPLFFILWLSPQVPGLVPTAPESPFGPATVRRALAATQLHSNEKNRAMVHGIEPNHVRMREMVGRLFEYFTFAWHDPSGYPYEGLRWDDETRSVEPIRQYTQITAIGQAGEFLASIVNGEIVFPPISVRDALDLLALWVRALQRDQDDPRVSENGLPIAFMEFDRENHRMRPPLPYEITPDVLPEKWGKKRTAIWERLEERKWLVRKDPDTNAAIVNRSAPGFGRDLGPDFSEALGQVNEILNRRVKKVVAGDAANLVASLVSTWGRLFKARESVAHGEDVTRQITTLMAEIDGCIAVMGGGFREDFLDETTGMLRRGLFVYDADGHGNKEFFNAYHNFSDEFISGILLAKVIYGLPLSVVRNVSIAIKEYVDRESRALFTKVPFFGGAFAILWPTLYIPYDPYPSDRRLLSNFVHIAVDYAQANGLQPGFLSECYGMEGYSGKVGIPSIAYAGGVRSDLISLYPLGSAYGIAPQEIEGFLDANWQRAQEIGFWDSYDLKAGRVVRIATAAHTLSNILGALRSGPSHVEVYLKAHGLWAHFLSLFEPGRVKVDLSRSPVEAKAEPPGASPVTVEKTGEGSRFSSNGSVVLTLTFFPGEVSLSGTTLVLRYGAETDTIKGGRIVLERPDQRVLPPGVGMQNEVFFALKNTHGRMREIRVPLPSTPALAGVDRVQLWIYGLSDRSQTLGLTIGCFEFLPP
jgi:hypothetical protein